MAYDIKTKEKVKTSCGILITLNNKVLLCHPTNASYIGTFSPPKGEKDSNENLIDTAIRECFEETSILINKNQIKSEYYIPYNNKKGSKYKEVFLYHVNINSLSEINLDSEIISKDKLQLNEVDWAGFLDKKEADTKIFWRFKHILNEIFN